MTNFGKLFSGELTEWLLEAGFIQYQCQMSIYYKYALGGTKLVVLYYVYYCVYWYDFEALLKWSVAESRLPQLIQVQSFTRPI